MSIDDLWNIERTIRNEPDYFERLFRAAEIICGFTHKETMYHLHKHKQEEEAQNDH